MQLESGIKSIKGFIFSRNFIVEEAVLCAAKVAYVSLLVKYNKSTVEYFDSRMDMRNINIENPIYKKGFKTIKKFSPEAYYWYKAIELYNKNSKSK